MLRGGFLYTASAGGTNVDGVMVDGLEGRVHESCENLRSICEAAGLTLEHVCYIQVFLGSLTADDYELVLAALAGEFPAGNRPTRCTVGVQRDRGFWTMNAVVAVDLASKRPVQLPPAVFNNNGAFAPGVRAGSCVFIGGQLGRDPATQTVPPTAAEQARIALRRFGEVIFAAGLGWRHVALLSVATTMTDPAAIAAIEAAVAEQLGDAGGGGGGGAGAGGSGGGLRRPAGLISHIDRLPEGAHISCTGVAIANPAAAADGVHCGPVFDSSSPFGSFGSGAGIAWLCATGKRALAATAGQPPPSAERQLRQALAELGAALAELGLGFEDVVSTQLYVPMADLAFELSSLSGAWCER